MNTQFKDFLRSYVGTALWSSSDNLPGYDEEKDGYIEPTSLDDYVSDTGALISLSTVKCMILDCRAFIAKAEPIFDESEDEYLYAKGSDVTYVVPHDFWLTRNGHGAGFWDGDYPDCGDKLTALCDTFGEHELYIGDDGRIYG